MTSPILRYPLEGVVPVVRGLTSPRSAPGTDRVLDAMDLGSLLRHYRTRARLTQIELADLTTISLRTIRNLESGRTVRPRPGTIRLLAEGLRLTAESRATLSLAADQSPVSAALDAAQGRLPEPTGVLCGNPIGRDRDIRSLLEAVRTGASQMISITGFGGVGKSRLAAALARESQRTLRTPWLWLRAAGPWESLTGSVGETFTRWNRGLVDGQPEAAEELAQMIAERPFLIVVDDAPGRGSSLDAALHQMIVRCPRLRIVETTRRPQHQAGRRIVRLKPLHVPVLDVVMLRHMDEHPVLQFFLPLVRAAQPDFEESRENLRHALDVCRSLDGLPLALEAAARWFACYPPAQVAQAARDDPGMLAASSDGLTRRNWLLEALDDALGCLTAGQRALLLELAARIAPWTGEELAAEMRSMSADLTASIHALLAVGVIRSADAGDQAFTVLNVLRSALVSTPGLSPLPGGSRSKFDWVP